MSKEVEELIARGIKQAHTDGRVAGGKSVLDSLIQNFSEKPPTEKVTYGFIVAILTTFRKVQYDGE